MLHTGIFMCSLSSGQSLVIGSAAVEYLFEVWLRDFVLHNVCSLLLRKHTAICLRFECVGCGHVTGTCLFCFRRQSHFPCQTWKSLILHSLLRCYKKKTLLLGIKQLLLLEMSHITSLSWVNWWFIIWYVENVKWRLFLPRAINPFSAQVWNNPPSSVHAVK